MNWDAVSEAWFKKKQLWPQENEHPDWGFNVKMSTHRVWDWSVRASHIPPDAVWLGFRIHRVLGWSARVFTRDKRYEAQWESSGLSVESDQFRYRRLTAWPAITDVDDFPRLIPALEQLLSIRFLPCATVEVPSLTCGQIERLRRWLKPACDEVDLQVDCLIDPLSPSLANYVADEDRTPPSYRFVLPTGELGGADSGLVSGH